MHDDVIKLKYFPRYWPFVRGIHRSPVNSPRKGQWCGALMFSLICAWINDWVNNLGAGDLRRHRAHYDVIVMVLYSSNICQILLHNRQLVNHYQSPICLFKLNRKVTSHPQQKCFTFHWTGKYIPIAQIFQIYVHNRKYTSQQRIHL